ncbi:MAG TPA: dihydrolipoamide acetyltransferase family protein [Polyangiaceae bacterium]|nr:dihydrolipoamide acetyltransferase family protein [Polyangiaceae bacterium]
MSTFEFKLPDIGEGVSEGEIVNWLVKVGDTVAADQDMVEVMTDKATVTIGAPKAGRVAELRAQQGEVVPVGKVLVVLALGEGAGASESVASASKEAAAPAPAAPVAPAAAPAAPVAPASTATTASAVGDLKDNLPGLNAASAAGSYFEESPLAAPATRKLARELGVDLRQVRPTGSSGRVTPEDVRAFATSGRKGGASAAVTTPSPGAPLPPPAPVASSAADQRVPIRGIRKRVYESMARSKHTAAHFTYVEECNCEALIASRTRAKDFAEKEGVRLNYLPFIVKSVVQALKRHPMLNTVVDDSTMEMIHKGGFDIGIATATDAGLIVPVLRNADRLNLLEIAREIERLANEARAGKTRREDLGGSSFTITSLGKLGGMFATPVVNYPEVAILYIPEMKKLPVVKGDQVVVGNVLHISLSFDHRIIDGHIGAAFAQEVVSFLENPDRLLMELR